MEDEKFVKKQWPLCEEARSFEMWTTTIDEHGRLVISAAKEKISEIARRLADPMSQYNEEYARYWEELNTYWTNYNQGVDGVYPSRPPAREEPSLWDFEQRYIHEVVRAIRTQLSISVLFEREPARVNALTDGAAMLLVDTGCGLEVFGEQLIVRRPSDFFIDNPGRFYQINPKYIVRIWFDPNYMVRSWLNVVAEFGKVTFSVV